MKIIISTFIIILAFGLYCKAQSDTLVLNLRNSPVEKIAVSQIQSIKFENITSIKEQTQQTSNLDIKGNFPNPFKEQTNIVFEIADVGNVVIFIYDNRGKQIQKLECKNCQAGKNTFQWNCLDENNNKVQSGVYFYEVHLGKEAKGKKMLLIGVGK